MDAFDGLKPTRMSRHATPLPSEPHNSPQRENQKWGIATMSNKLIDNEICKLLPLQEEGSRVRKPANTIFIREENFTW